MDNKLNDQFPDDLGKPHIKKGCSWIFYILNSMFSLGIQLYIYIYTHTYRVIKPPKIKQITLPLFSVFGFYFSISFWGM